MHTDTISAVATPSSEGAVGIIRLSGKKSLEIIQKIFRPKREGHFDGREPNKLVYGHIIDEKADIVDEVLCVYMKAPHSYTAEDVVEVQCHGGIVARQKILSLTYQNGARPAEPGEFTKRAFLNGRIDLAQAEAVMSIIKAGSDIALKQAMYQQRGLFSKEIKKYRDTLKELLVETEVVLDYPEEDLEEITTEKILATLKPLQEKIEALLQSAKTGRIIKEGLRTVIVGRPNVGKSSLLNALAGEDIAIVTAIEGTTRDSIEEQLFFDGLPMVLIDTAGIRHTEDEIEKIGIDRSRKKLDQADMALLLVDGSKDLSCEDKELLFLVKQKPHILLINKSDLVQKLDKEHFPDIDEKDIVTISIKEKIGWKEFSDRLKEKVYGESKILAEGIYVQEARHKALLADANSYLKEAIFAAGDNMPVDCMTIDIKNAFDVLGCITGETVSDEIINEIFSRFCLGK